jgi:hypothetical protein
MPRVVYRPLESVVDGGHYASDETAVETGGSPNHTAIIRATKNGI